MATATAKTGPFRSLQRREWANLFLAYANELCGEGGTIDRTYLSNLGTVILIKRAWDCPPEFDKFLIVAGFADGSLTVNGMACETAAFDRFEAAVGDLKNLRESA